MIVMPESGLDFDEERHAYALNGLRMPSVTQILKPLSLMVYDGIPAQTLSEAADRGTRAHAQVSNYVIYGVDESDADTEPFTDAFKLFCGMYNPVWVASEYRTYHKQLRYAGTADLIGYATPDDGSGVDVIDIKTTAAWHQVLLSPQVSAYAEMLKSHGIKVRNLYGLQLLKSGRFRFEKLEDGYKTFLHCLAIHNVIAHDLRINE